MSEPSTDDPFAHLKQRAGERADRTVERIIAGIAALHAMRRKITGEAIKDVTRDLEPGFAGLSFQVVRRNARAHALYHEAADAFRTVATTGSKQRSRRRRRTRSRGQEPRSSYDPLQCLDKRDLVLRIRNLERELDAERRLRAALAYDQQALRARLLRFETEDVFSRQRLHHPRDGRDYLIARVHRSADTRNSVAHSPCTGRNCAGEACADHEVGITLATRRRHGWCART